MDARATPYLSVVVTTRNDDHGGDPLKRLQAFVNSFDEQCRRTGLDAEVIVVEWNPPSDRPRVSSLLRLPKPSSCTYRFIDVPPELHQQLRFADVLPLFQMIAKNVGIRRARGRFVLATNIDIVLSTELVEHIAERSLEPRRLYRVDRHDIQPNVPLNAPLESQIGYCASHQLRVHTRWGSNPVDSRGRLVCESEDDIVDGCGVRLGAGWHVRESAGPGRPFRWAKHVATLVVDAAAAGLDGEVALDLDIESNPYDSTSWIEVLAHDGRTSVATKRVSGRMRLRVPLGVLAQAAPRAIELRVAGAHAESRTQLPVFERRDAMFYRVYSATVSPVVASDNVAFEYPVEGWHNANPQSELSITSAAEGLVVASDRRRWSYCVRYRPFRAPRRGTYRFEVACTILEGRVALGVLSGGDRFWIPSTVTHSDDPPYRHFELTVDLPAREECSLVLSNDHPDGTGVTRFVVHKLRGNCDPRQMIPDRDPSQTRAHLERRALAYARFAPRARAIRSRWSQRGWKSRAADRLARVIVKLVGDGVRYRIARTAPEYQNLEHALRSVEGRVRELAPLQDLADVHRFLREQRPDNLHVNGCGDFQLMAREHWDELRGYPEFQTFSMNIDGLFSYIAEAAGIREEMLPMPIYHLEHEVGSGWSPEGEAVLRKRIAERGITWVDASTVYVWAAYMKWLGRPMIFNGSDWGMAAAQLPERSSSDSSVIAS